MATKPIVKIATIKNKAEEILQGWDGLSNEGKMIRIQEQLMQWNTDPNREAVKQAEDVLNTIIGVGMYKADYTQPRTPIGFKR